jgi:hypothetical protein
MLLPIAVYNNDFTYFMFCCCQRTTNNVAVFAYKKVFWHASVKGLQTMSLFFPYKDLLKNGLLNMFLSRAVYNSNFLIVHVLILWQCRSFCLAKISYKPVFWTCSVESNFQQRFHIVLILLLYQSITNNVARFALHKSLIKQFAMFVFLKLLNFSISDTLNVIATCEHRWNSQGHQDLFLILFAL